MPNCHHIPHAVVAETRYPPAKQPNHPDQYPVVELLAFQEMWLQKKNNNSKTNTKHNNEH